ncbi:hypothetical protein AB0F07_14560 [Streptomyces fructofermentans]|uniref:hypothetical protein n=1 Tax=Streptomyces fructofermentans TaxID=152141 RepID=UPI0033C32273
MHRIARRPGTGGRVWRALLASAAALLVLTTGASAPATAAVRVPDGVIAGVAVFDRQTGTFTEQLDSSAKFRSASVVKLLIALDYLLGRAPTYSVPAADRARLEPMLRGSDDAAANHYWSANGGSGIVRRMVDEVGLTDTDPPPAGQEGFWGYTALSARDTVRIYRYLLETAPAPVREFVMGNLRQSTRCATDGYDQHFGIAGAFDRPWAVKQGWAGSSFPAGTCTTGASSAGTSSSASGRSPASDAAPDAPALDLARPALHSTGTVGSGDRTIVAVLTLHPVGTSYGKAYTDIGRLTRSLNVPGGTPPAGTWFGTWSDHVNVRRDPSTGNPPITQLPAGVEVLVGCQRKGQAVSVPPYNNDWWAYLPQYGGYISNIYVSSPENKLPNVPECSGS